MQCGIFLRRSNLDGTKSFAPFTENGVGEPTGAPRAVFLQLSSVMQKYGRVKSFNSILKVWPSH